MTAPTKTEAKDIVLALLEEGLIACANIIPGVESYFSWEDGINKANETVVIFKTRVKNEDKIIRLVRSIHSYDCPCIVFTSLQHGNRDFMKWVGDMC